MAFDHEEEMLWNFLRFMEERRERQREREAHQEAFKKSTTPAPAPP